MAFSNLRMPLIVSLLDKLQSPFQDDIVLESMIREIMMSDLCPAFIQLQKKEVKTKNAKTAAVEYTKGKRALEKNNNKEALKAFTDALIAAPKSSEQIISCYINRSLCLQKLKAYPESLDDINRALKLSLTQEEKEVLLKRKKVIESVLLTRNVQKLKITEDSEELELSYGENQEIVGVSSALSLAYNEKFGRHYIANQDIKIGDFLMIQKPFVHAPLPDSITSASKNLICDNCLKMTINPIPCENCVMCLYCDEACRLEAFHKFHRIECEICQRYSLDLIGVALRSLIIATNQGEKVEEIFNLMEKVDNCKDKRECGFDSNGKLDGTKPEALMSLLTHSDKRKQTLNIIDLASVTYFLRKNTNFFKGYDNYENVLKLAKLLLRLSYICTMNLYFIRGDDVSDHIAGAMYPVCNYLNNSCSNNAFWYDQQNKKILRACKDIKKGEQVYVAYLAFGVKNMKYEMRQEYYQKVKFFTCYCEACEKKYDYKLELKGNLKIPKGLKKSLLSKPNDISSLWELLRLVHKKCRGPSLESKEIEIALANSLMGSKNEAFPYTLARLKLI